MASYEKVVVVRRNTQLESLLAQFTTTAQARFYLEHAGQDFAPVQAAHDQYQRVVDAIRRAIPKELKQHVIDRDFLPSYRFETTDIIVTIGPDGLVVNAAKYLHGQPIIAVNPDPDTIDGVLLPFCQHSFAQTMQNLLQGNANYRHVTMAAATLDDGQRLTAFNDLFIGANSHVSARYQINISEQHEEHSSSGIIVSTGAGSTGWLRSIYAGAAGVVEALGGKVSPAATQNCLPWDSDKLIYSVREPFPSKVTQTNLIYGLITGSTSLTITSRMSQNGVIFSDGIEQDYLSFNAGAVATIGVAEEMAILVVEGG